MDEYFIAIKKQIDRAYSLAKKARGKGWDPIDDVEIPLAENMAERVEGLIITVAPSIKGKGLVERIMGLEKKYGTQDWRVALAIALETAQEKFCKFENKKEAMEVGIRVGLAYLTNGVVASPLEGFTRLGIKKRRDGKEYFALYFSGPIRSAGGTAASVSILVADYVRKKMGYDVYDPNEAEMKRIVTEMRDYHERVTNLQYMPSDDEIMFLMKNLPVQIDGDPSEKIEVSNYKNLDRIETNIVRNGVCLIVGEGIAQKAKKIYGKFSKYFKEFNLEHWNFLNDFVELQKKIRSRDEVKGTIFIEPDYNFIVDLVAGRPVLTYPLRQGGFRLRYGRARNSGFSSCAIHPATMVVLRDYIAIGTQLKMERPGKATTLAVCDKLEGPIVKLNNGGVLFLEDEKQARKYMKDIDEILYLGDILVNYGDFLDRGHKLVPCGYNEEWYLAELEQIKSKNSIVRALIRDRFDKISSKDAIELSQKFNISLHPRYSYHWKAISKEQLDSLFDWLDKAKIDSDKIVLPYIYSVDMDVEERDPKRVLELLGVPHVVRKDKVVVSGDDANVLSFCLRERKEGDDVLEIINAITGIKIRNKGGTFIGARMGRPEKAKMRKMTGSPHVLFPVGSEGGKMRSFQTALEKGKVTSEFSVYYCNFCKRETIYPSCEICDRKTERKIYCNDCDKYADKKCEKEKHRITKTKITGLDINHYFNHALKRLNLRVYGDLIKGVRGMSSGERIPENLIKGILRSKYDIYVNKDGTTRYDMTEMTITSFRPKEIGTSVKKLRILGYTKDIYGKLLTDENQMVALKAQDIILPACDKSLEKGSDEILFKVGKFVDELLVKLYGLWPFYNFEGPEDLVGNLVVCMSPHTSAGIVGRIIGFSKTQGFLAHPLLHSIMRRDCDGDEACVILLMDVLLNFSRKFLPGHRGARQDAPLVLTYKLIPTEVDDMVFNMDIMWRYPLEFYEAALKYKNPWDIKMDIFADVLNTAKQYEGLGFTHDTEDINGGVLCSAYKSIPTMMEKVQGQMEIAEKIRAVDENDVARLVVERHFIRDIRGNLRKFSMQQFRCVNCNGKYRRPPLVGKCKCGGRIIFTIAKGGIVKYLEPSLQLAQKYSLPPYLRQTLELTKRRIESVFGKDKDKQEGLQKWF